MWYRSWGQVNLATPCERRVSLGVCEDRKSCYPLGLGQKPTDHGPTDDGWAAATDHGPFVSRTSKAQARQPANGSTNRGTDPRHERLAHGEGAGVGRVKPRQISGYYVWLKQEPSVERTSPTTQHVPANCRATEKTVPPPVNTAGPV